MLKIKAASTQQAAPRAAQTTWQAGGTGWGCPAFEEAAFSLPKSPSCSWTTGLIYAGSAWYWRCLARAPGSSCQSVISFAGWSLFIMLTLV